MLLPLFINQERWGCVKEEAGMEDRKDKKPPTGSESDISKSQSQQQPASQDRQQTADQDQSSQPDQPSSGQSGFGETATEQRSDVEGSSLGKEPTAESESGFVGSESETDTSSKLVEDEEQKFRKGSEEAPEGK